ncbi:MAG: hypothetical protein ACLSFT_07490 [Ruminococcus callidus]
MSATGDPLLVPMKEIVKREVYTRDSAKYRNRDCKLGNDAGIIVAAFWATPISQGYRRQPELIHDRKSCGAGCASQGFFVKCAAGYANMPKHLYNFWKHDLAFYTKIIG